MFAPLLIPLIQTGISFLCPRAPFEFTQKINFSCPPKFISAPPSHAILAPGLDVMNCDSYAGVKLLEHGMKIIERVLERGIRAFFGFDEAQFGFMPPKGQASKGPNISRNSGKGRRKRSSPRIL